MCRCFMKAVLAASLIALLVTTLAVLAVPAPAASADHWLQFQHDAAHSGFNPGETRLTTRNVSALSLLWASQPFGQAINSTPIPARDRVLAATWEGPVVAVDRHTGSPIWTADVPLPTTRSTPVVSGTLAIVSAGRWELGGIVIAYDVLTGRQVWSTPLRDPVGPACPALFRGKIYLGAGRTLYALSASTGKILWSNPVSADVDNGITGPPAVSCEGTLVIAADGTGHLFAVRRSTGRRVWRRTLGGGIWLGGPSIAGRTGYIPNGDVSSEGGGVSLYAFRVATGRILWKQDCGDDVHVTPTVGRGVVYVGAINGTMHAIDARSGAVRWVAEVPGEVWSSPALANHVLYVGTESALLALDARNGHEYWRTSVADLGYANMSSPAVTRGRVYIGSGGGTIQVFGLPD